MQIVSVLGLIHWYSDETKILYKENEIHYQSKMQQNLASVWKLKKSQKWSTNQLLLIYLNEEDG